MARQTKVAALEKPKPDLTPMIDIVFNLIIFFLIVSELSNLTVEDLSLAYASEAAKPVDGPGRVVVVNVKEPDVAIVNGESLALKDELGALTPTLRDRLQLESAAVDDPATPGSELEVTLRVDKDVPFGGVHQALDACIRNDIFKTRFSATPQAPGN